MKKPPKLCNAGRARWNRHEFGTETCPESLRRRRLDGCRADEVEPELDGVGAEPRDEAERSVPRAEAVDRDLEPRPAGCLDERLDVGEIPGGGLRLLVAPLAVEGLGLLDLSRSVQRLGIVVLADAGRLQIQHLAEEDQRRGFIPAGLGKLSQAGDTAGHLAALPEERLALGLARDARVARADAGGQQHLVEAGQRVRAGARAQAQLHAGELQAAAEVAQRLAELLLARDEPRHVELAADVLGRLEQRDRMTALGQRGGRGASAQAR